MENVLCDSRKYLLKIDITFPNCEYIRHQTYFDQYKWTYKVLPEMSISRTDTVRLHLL